MLVDQIREPLPDTWESRMKFWVFEKKYLKLLLDCLRVIYFMVKGKIKILACDPENKVLLSLGFFHLTFFAYLSCKKNLANLPKQIPNLPNKSPKPNPLLNGEFGDLPSCDPFMFSPINEETLIRVCGGIKTSNGSGVDCISSFFLKIGISVLAPSLVQLFNLLSLSLGRFQDSWKLARVAPIFKDGATDDKSNYRPISVLPVISRLFEKLIFDQLYDFLNRNQLIFLLQSAFRKLHSVLTCLLKSTNNWYLNIDKGRYTAAVFINLKKAFDTVDHDILLNKQNYYGVRGKELSLFRSYLFNRKQFCTVNGHTSATEGVGCGVPKGSCLGPLLFLVYVNDLPYCLKTSDVAMYADDTTTYYSSPSMNDINTAINADLEALRG